MTTEGAEGAAAQPTPEGERRPPPIGAGHREAVDEEEQPARHRHSSRDVVAGAHVRPALLDEAPGAYRGHDRDGRVDQQGPTPRRQLGQGTAQDKAMAAPPPAMAP